MGPSFPPNACEGLWIDHPGSLTVEAPLPPPGVAHGYDDGDGDDDDGDDDGDDDDDGDVDGDVAMMVMMMSCW